MKKTLLIVTIVVLIVALVACSSTAPTVSSAAASSAAASAAPASSSAAASAAPVSSSAASPAASVDTSKLKFGASLMALDNPYFISIRDGFMSRCKELGIQASVVDAKVDAATQYSQVENMVTSGVNGILLAAVDGTGITPVVTEAKGKGIAVLGEAQPVDAADANFIVNEYNYGYNIGSNAAMWINDKLGGKANVLVISEDNVVAAKKRGDGIIDAIKALAPNAVIVSRQSGDQPDQAMAHTEAQLQAHPEINVIACVNDSSGLGAYKAVKNIVKDTTNFYVGAADATAEAQAAMKEQGSFYRSTIDIDPVGTGSKCVDMLVSLLNGGQKGQTTYFDQKPVWQDALKDYASKVQFKNN
jgi:ribose transport system substrate-binding protein